MKLQDIFQEGADYITPISRKIKEQMQEQMAQDEMIRYWINQECEEWNFETITDETAFYLNEKGNVVICFNEGDVAPMYMEQLNLKFRQKFWKIFENRISFNITETFYKIFLNIRAI